MTSTNMKKFLVFYQIPAAVVDDWGKTDPAIRKTAEEKMHADWNSWMAAHGKMILSTEVGGKTRRVTTKGVSDTSNDIILYSLVEAETPDAVAKAFESHPHLGVPQSSIDVMEVRAMG